MRIVGGRLRGRTLAAPKSQAIRPTADRLRESLFNILVHAYGDPVTDARVLDLFAGTGALGLEALSRGAQHVTFIESDPLVAAAIRSTLAELKSERGEVLERDAYTWLAGAPAAFDIVFLDPPFAQGGREDLCKLLETRGWLAPGAFIYLEHAAHEAAPALPPAWTPWREMRAGDVHALVAHRQAP